MTRKPNRAQIIRWIRRFGIRQFAYIMIGAAGLVAFALLAREVPVQKAVQAIHNYGPLPFFTSMALLPVIGFPVTPFYLLAGATFGIWTSIVGTAVSQAINLFLAYWLARRYLRNFIENLIKKRGRYKIPELKSKHYVNFTLVVKVTPGPPNFVKSFILGLARVPFGIFFIISWPTTMGYAVGVIIFGDSLVERDVTQAVVGFALMILFLVGLKYAANYYSRRRGLHDPTTDLDEEEVEPGSHQEM